MSTMKHMNSDYRHPKHDAISRLVREGMTNLAVAQELSVDRRAVARVRVMLGIPPKTNGTSPEHKLDRFTTEPDMNGHVFWTGRTGPSGTPVIRHMGKQLPAAAVAFERRTGQPPVGTCRSGCGVMHCVADAHVRDDLERRYARMQERAVYGLDPQPWDECPEGHSWGIHGRVAPDLTPYCRQCKRDRATRSTGG